MKYFIGLIEDMTLDELEVWRNLCKYSNFESNIAGYTVNQIVLSCDSRLNLTTQKVRTIIKKFTEKGYMKQLEAGTKGRETKSKLLLKDLLFNGEKLTMIQQASNNDKTVKSEESQQLEEVSNNNLTIKQQSFNNTTKNKEKEKDIKKEKVTNLDKIISAYTQNNDLVEAIKDFIKMRKSIKKPLTDRALKTILGKLDKFSRNDFERILIIENSIENCWQTVYELKDNKKGPVAAGPVEKNKNNNYNSSLCKTSNKNVQKVIVHNNF